jgi:hypothetical protein
VSTLERLAQELKEDIRVAREKRDECAALVRIQNNVIDALCVQLGRVEIAAKKEREPAK